MWAVMCVCRHVCHTQAQSCLSTEWALNRCFAWVSGTAAVLAQAGGGVLKMLGILWGIQILMQRMKKKFLTPDLSHPAKPGC